MNAWTFLPPLFAGLSVFVALLSLLVFRLPLIIRNYTFSSFFLGLAALSLGVLSGANHVIFIAAVMILIKTILIPSILSRTAERSGASMRLTSSVRPAPTYFIVALLLLLLFFMVQRSPFFASVHIGYFLYVSVALVMAGCLLMVMRRNIYAQTLGFLTMENGITAFALAAAEGVPFVIETGILSLVLIAAVLMALLSHRVRELYGTEDTSYLRELID